LTCIGFYVYILLYEMREKFEINKKGKNNK